MTNDIAHTGLIPDLFDDCQLHIPKGAKVLVELPKQDKPVSNKPPFVMVGNGGKNRMYEAYPLIDTLLDLSKPEAWFMKMLFKSHQSKTGISNIPYSNLSITDKKVASKAYKLLKDRNLVKRVKLHDYMINPTALITVNFEEHIKVWNDLDKPKPKKGMYNYISFIPNGFWLKSYKTWDSKTKMFNTEVKNV